MRWRETAIGEWAKTERRARREGCAAPQNFRLSLDVGERPA
jgi:hypothetical protein